MTFSLVPFGDQEAMSAFRSYMAEVKEMQKDVVNEVSAKLETKTKTYPPTRPGSPYVRTYEFQRAIRRVSSAGETTYTVEAPVDPGEFVIGEKQTWFHAGRWTLFAENADAAEEELYQRLDTEMQKLLSKYGF